MVTWLPSFEDTDGFMANISCNVADTPVLLSAGSEHNTKMTKLLLETEHEMA